MPDAVLDQLLAGAYPKTAFDPNGLIDDLKKALAEWVFRRDGSLPGRRVVRQPA
jgi:putative transposase